MVVALGDLVNERTILLVADFVVVGFAADGDYCYCYFGGGDLALPWNSGDGVADCVYHHEEVVVVEEEVAHLRPEPQPRLDLGSPLRTVGNTIGAFPAEEPHKGS